MHAFWQFPRFYMYSYSSACMHFGNFRGLTCIPARPHTRFWKIFSDWRVFFFKSIHASERLSRFDVYLHTSVCMHLSVFRGLACIPARPHTRFWKIFSDWRVSFFKSIHASECFSRFDVYPRSSAYTLLEDFLRLACILF